MSIDIRFTEEDWERIERDWNAWWAGELERPMVVLENYEPAAGDPVKLLPPGGRPIYFPLDVPVEEMMDCYGFLLERTRFYGDAFPRWWPDFGAGIVAGFLGARVRPAPETVWFESPGALSIEALQLEYDEGNLWWRRIQAINAYTLQHWDNQVCLGHTDLGGNLDILASFRGAQQLLMDLYDAPEEVARLAGQITSLWLRYYNEIDRVVSKTGRGTSPWAAIWSPGRCYMLQSDFSYMISPRMFERFVLPDLYACCQALDHGFYHLDGKGQLPHLDHLLSIERLRGIQWVPGDGTPPPESWLPLLSRIRAAGKRCQLNVPFEGARKIVRALGGKGFAFHIEKDRNLTPQEAQGMVDELLDLSSR